MSVKNLTLFVSFTVLVVFLGGCGGAKDSKKPSTVPVSGKVVDRSGKPLTQGNIEFTPVKAEGEAPLFVNGEIQKDGGFSLNTIYGKEKLTGAPEGQYQVTIAVDPKGAIPPVSLATKYTIKAGENLTIKMEK